MQPANEALRFERLRAQDGQPLVPPPSVRSLSSGRGLDPGQVSNAESMWSAAQAEMSTHPSYPAEERLFWTAFMLSNLFAEQQVRPRSVDLIQRTLPALTQARHQQVLTGMLVRNLGMLGRVDEAAALLPRLDPHSEDLQIDTCYRFTTAFVSLLRNDPQAVLAVLGSEIDDVPIADAYDTLCGVFRAHAHELLGNLEVAKRQLQQLAPEPHRVEALESVVRSNPQLGLLPRSLPAVKVEVTAMHDNALVTNSGLKVGRIMAVSFLGVPIVMGAVFLGEEVLPASVAPYVMGVVIALVTLGMIAMTFGSLFAGARRRKQLWASGLRGTGRLMSVQQTGTRVNDQPMLRLRMMVELPGKPAYAVVHQEVVPQIRLAQVQPGARVAVCVDPNEPRNMAIAWG